MVFLLVVLVVVSREDCGAAIIVKVDQVGPISFVGAVSSVVAFLTTIKAGIAACSEVDIVGAVVVPVSLLVLGLLVVALALVLILPTTPSFSFSAWKPPSSPAAEVHGYLHVVYGLGCIREVVPRIGWCSISEELPLEVLWLGVPVLE